MADDTNLSPKRSCSKKFEALEAQNTELAAALSGIQQFNAELVHVLFECKTTSAKTTRARKMTRKMKAKTKILPPSQEGDVGSRAARDRP